MSSGAYDLEDRLLEFSIRIVKVTRSLERSRAASHIGDQLLRSGTSPYGNHGEVEGAESTDDFIHKLKVCYKELREARRWLRLIQRVPLVPKPHLLDGLIGEAEELVKIFAASIRTMRRHQAQQKRRPPT